MLRHLEGITARGRAASEDKGTASRHRQDSAGSHEEATLGIFFFFKKCLFGKSRGDWVPSKSLLLTQGLRPLQESETQISNTKVVDYGPRWPLA